MKLSVTGCQHCVYKPVLMEHTSSSDKINRFYCPLFSVFVHLNISYRSTHAMAHDDLEYCKVCARWVPKQLVGLHGGYDPVPET